jgi:hypothetical protein
MLSGNTLINDPLHFVSGSQQNVLTDNTIVGQAIKFNKASSNQAHNLTIEAFGGRPSIGYDFTSSSNNVIVRSEALGPTDYDIKAVTSSKNNVFTNFSAAPPFLCSVDKTSSVRVTDPDGYALPCGKSSTAVKK